MKLEFSRQIFEKCSHIKFHENASSGSRVDTSVRADRHDETSGRVFATYANEPEMRRKLGVEKFN
jgi:hypothetical protein